MGVFSDIYFTKEYNRYCETRNNGLKKPANNILENLMIYFDGLDDGVKCSICDEFCRLYENGEIEQPQYFLSQRICSVLRDACEKNRMPHLRWYYELTRDTDMLLKAYQHPECDERTAVLLAEHYLYELWHGAHHMPECCLLDKNGSGFIINKLENLFERHDLRERFCEEFSYYKSLYSDWWEYGDNGFGCSFDEWCIQKGRRYSWIPAYFYK